MEKLPSKSVTVPVEVPFTMTLAPMTGSPAVSTTVPDTLLWANDIVAMSSIKKVSISRWDMPVRLALFSFSFFIAIRFFVVSN